jgi:hypothetical protein
MGKLRQAAGPVCGGEPYTLLGPKSFIRNRAEEAEYRQREPFAKPI